ncbi:hypothetical protein Y032_0219g2465 [Ancylostoma ceylanicum]|uniref:Uncharacterized protein n=1 Tax=Ancylostoma ceylanicum TaxID=53326 RepID=A0A016SJF0_9BILA|nr:hypothetical protein Y032_0219g2465 [Ancylostoma ceylanicum]
MEARQSRKSVPLHSGSQSPSFWGPKVADTGDRRSQSPETVTQESWNFVTVSHIVPHIALVLCHVIEVLIERSFHGSDSHQETFHPTAVFREDEISGDIMFHCILDGANKFMKLFRRRNSFATEVGSETNSETTRESSPPIMDESMSKTLYRYHDFDHGYGCTTTTPDLVDDDTITATVPELVYDYAAAADDDDDVEETLTVEKAPHTHEKSTRELKVR